MTLYYVTGGVYTDLTFTALLAQESHGPFRTRAEAVSKWRERAYFNVDNACHRLTVVATDEMKLELVDEL